MSVPVSFADVVVVDVAADDVVAVVDVVAGRPRCVVGRAAAAAAAGRSCLRGGGVMVRAAVSTYPLGLGFASFIRVRF